MTVTLDGKPIEVTAYEFSILRALAQRPGRVLSREQLLDLAKGSADLSFDRSIDVHVSRLRAKLGDDSRSPKILKTVRGVGYMLAGGDDVSRAAKLALRLYASRPRRSRSRSWSRCSSCRASSAARATSSRRPRSSRTWSIAARSREPAKLAEAIERWRQRLRGKLTLFDAERQRHRIDVRAAARARRRPPSARRSQTRQVGRSTGAASSCAATTARWSASTCRTSPGFPWGFVLPLGAGVLLVVGRRDAVVLAPARPAARHARRCAARSSAPATPPRARSSHRDDELGDVGRAFDDMADRTSALISSQRQLMADVSHELRTPLARIRVALELAAEDPRRGEGRARPTSARDLDEIDQLIERHPHDRAPRRRQRRSSASRSASASSPIAPSSGSPRVIPAARSSATVDDAERAIECDPVLLRRALDNLLDNAAKYSDADRAGEARGPARTANASRSRSSITASA